MTRDEMLRRLSKIDYTEIWPDDDWKDIGYTELQIWLNGNRYGYFAHDEQSNCYKLAKIPDQKWRTIREKLLNKQLTIDDVQGTSLTTLYIIKEYDPNDQYDLNEELKELLKLPKSLGEFFYCAEFLGDYQFYNSEEEIYESIKRDDCHTKWIELNDDELAEWIKRLESIDMGIGFICE